ncbi:hypothetical protein OL233_03765 [Vagococcus sp. PNs007]|uniref:Hydrolase n=1 Tax=Vagococcus proximus TaxID=2991417 RepID=A0ABT5X0G4_9ENTE|nr:hypothetical protein [Vagococcus proximus]MDF0479397.1 hypothetical protein [Vagococcus proximus]
MGDRIEFPKNFEGYMKMAQDAEATGENEEALTLYEEAYDLQPDFLANTKIVKLLMAEGKFQEALGVCEEMLQGYFEEEELFMTYIQLLLGNQEFIKSRKMIKKNRSRIKNEEELLRLVDTSEEQYAMFNPEKIKAYKAEGREIKVQPFYQQMGTLKLLEKLPKNDYIDVVKELLVNDELPLLLRQSLLESVVAICISEEYEIINIYGERCVVAISEIPSPGEQRTYLEAKEVLEKKLEEYEDVFQTQMLEELRVNFSVMYPFADTWLTDVSLWVKQLLSNYLEVEFTEEEQNSEAFDKNKELLELIQKELVKIMQ